MIGPLCVLGACAAGAFGASAASASLPELGRCVPDAGKGAFTRSNCIGISKTHTGGFEFEPGPGAAPAEKQILGGVQLITPNKIKISCTDAQLTGQYTGAKTERITNLLIQGCELVGPLHQNCYTNPLEPGTIETENPLVGEIGFIPGSKIETNPWVGWDLKSENSAMPIVGFMCGEGGGTLFVKLEGSVIGKVTKTNVMASEFGLAYKQTEGKQIPSAFIGGEEDVLKETISQIGGATTEEQAGLAAGGPVTDGEALEIKAKP